MALFLLVLQNKAVGIYLYLTFKHARPRELGIIFTFHMIRKGILSLSWKLKCKKLDKLILLKLLWGHSKTTWTKFYPILTPQPPELEWIKMDILHTIYSLSHDPPWTFYCPPPLHPPLLAHVVVE